VTASDDKAVTAVHAAVSSQGWSRSVTVNRVSGNEKSGIWQGTYKAPPNTINQNVGYKIDLIAIDSDGNKSNPLSNWFPVMGTPGGSTPPTQYKYKK
jgi:hypothetical protein